MNHLLTAAALAFALAAHADTPLDERFSISGRRAN